MFRYDLVLRINVTAHDRSMGTGGVAGVQAVRRRVASRGHRFQLKYPRPCPRRKLDSRRQSGAQRQLTLGSTPGSLPVSRRADLAGTDSSACGLKTGGQLSNPATVTSLVIRSGANWTGCNLLEPKDLWSLATACEGAHDEDRSRGPPSEFRVDEGPAPADPSGLAAGYHGRDSE